MVRSLILRASARVLAWGSIGFAAAGSDRARAASEPPGDWSAPVAASRQRIEREALPDDGWTARLRLYEPDVRISVKPHTLRAPRFQVLAPDAAGRLRRVDVPAAQTYRGTVVGLPGSRVAAGIVNGRLHAAIVLDGLRWFVQPAGDFNPAAAIDEYAVYRDSDVPKGDGRCGVSANAWPLPGIPGDPPEGANCNGICEIAFDADFEFYEQNDSSIPNTVANIENVLNAVEAIYLADVGIEYELTTVIVQSNESDPYESTNPGMLLAEFQSYWNANQGAVMRDTAHLMTGKNLDGPVIGIASLGSVCNLGAAYGLSQSNYTGNFALRVALTSHELGHNWNALHCNNDPDCSIMCSGLGGCSGNITSFNPSSANAIIAYRNSASCLAPGGPYPPTAIDDDVSGLLDSPFTINVLANDVEPNCDPLSIIAFDAVTPSGAAVELAPDGQSLTYTPPVAFTGNDTFGYSIADDTGASDSAEVTVHVVALIEPVDEAYTCPGINATYYNLSASPPSVLPNFAALTPIGGQILSQINFPTTNGAFAGSGLSNDVGAVFEGYLYIGGTGAYRLYTESDDGSKLFIGPQLVVDNDGLHGMVEQSGVVGLSAGLHPIRVEFFEHLGGAGLIARISGNELPKQLIPPGLFRRASFAGNCNCNGGIGLVDHSVLTGCLNGPGGAITATCTCGDFDGDDDVDLSDVAAFENSFSGS